MGPASQESVFARQVGKGMFAQSKLATPDVLLMACAPMGPACVLMVRDNLEMQNFFLFFLKLVHLPVENMRTLLQNGSKNRLILIKAEKAFKFLPSETCSM